MITFPKIFDTIDKVYDWEKKTFQKIKEPLIGTGEKTGKPSILGVVKEVPETMAKTAATLTSIPGRTLSSFALSAFGNREGFVPKTIVDEKTNLLTRFVFGERENKIEPMEKYAAQLSDWARTLAAKANKKPKEEVSFDEAFLPLVFLGTAGGAWTALQADIGFGGGGKSSKTILKESLAELKTLKVMKNVDRKVATEAIMKTAEALRNVRGSLDDIPADVNALIKEAEKVFAFKGKGKVVESVASKVGKELEPLVTEARKYKSAEEFVESQFIKGIVSKDAQLTTIPTERFTGRVGVQVSGEATTIQARNFTDEAVQGWMKRIKAGERPLILVDKEGSTVLVRDGNNRLEAYKRLGIKDIPVIDNTGGKLPNNFYSSTKFQLTDIYNQAVKGVKEIEPTIQEAVESEEGFLKLGGELETLAQEARKYKSAEEFVRAQEQIPFSQSFSLTNKISIGSVDQFPISKESVFHGTNPLNVSKILESGQLEPKVSQFDESRQSVVSLSRSANVAETQGGQIVFEIPNKKVSVFDPPKGVVKGEETIKGFEVRSNKPVDLKDIDRVIIYLKKGQTLDEPIKDVVRIDRFGNTKLVEVDTFAGIKKKLEDKGIRVLVRDENLTKFQLTDIYNQAVKGKEVKPAIPKIFEASPAEKAGIYPMLDNKPPPPNTVRGLIDLTSGNGGKAGEEILNDLTKAEAKASVKQLIRTKVGEFDSMNLASEDFARKIEQATTEGERQLIPFLKEGITEKIYNVLPSEARKVIDKFNGVVKGKPQGFNLPPHLQKIGEIARKHYDEAHIFLKQYMDIDYIDDYINRVWDIPKQTQTKVAPYTTRKFITMKEGIDLGFIPRELDIANLIRLYDNFKNRIASNFKFAQGLKDIVYEGIPVILPQDKMPHKWESFPVPKAFQKALGLGDTMGVNPDIVSELKVVLEQPFTQFGTRAREIIDAYIAKEGTIRKLVEFGFNYNTIKVINAFAKKARFTLSLFHPEAIAESILGEKFKRKISVELIKSIITRKPYIFRHLAEAQDSVLHNLGLKPVSDVQAGIVNKTLSDMEWKLRNIPIAGKTAKFVRKANQIWDKGLWEYYQNTAKLMTYQFWVDYGLRKFKDKTADEIKYLAARHANNAFGGQVWEVLGVSQKFQQQLQLAFLSPDWSYSVIKQMIDPFSKDKFIRKMGRTSVMRAAFYLYTIANAVNYATTSLLSENKKGRFMWNNTGRNKFRIFVGYDEQGKEKYVRVGKQFTEIMDYFTNTLQLLKNKTSPYIHIGLDTIGNPFLQEKNLPSAALEVGKNFISNFEPFSIAANNFFFTLPQRAGYTEYTAREAMMKAIEKNDESKLKEIFNDALKNNLDAQKLMTQAKTQVKAEISKDAKTKAEKILLKLNKMTPEERSDYVNKLVQDGKIDNKVNDWIWKLIIERKKTNIEKEIYLNK